MKYEIESKQSLSGAVLIVRFPEKDLDSKALYTIEADQPDFLIPFRYRTMDGQIECMYQLGNRSKLQYRYGRRSPEEYLEFWEQLLQPLLDCGDWFLKPFSFVLDTRYLYIDTNGKTISYLYVPTRQDYADFDDLKAMAAELSKQNPVTDTGLENKVLRAIMQDFQPKDFLRMLRETAGKAPVKQPEPEFAAGSVYEQAGKDMPLSGDLEEKEVPFAEYEPMADPEEIVINLDGKKKKEKKAKKEKGKGLFGGKKEKQELEKKQKDKSSKEIILGAGADMIPDPMMSAPSVVSGPRSSAAAPVYHAEIEEIELTQLDDAYNRTCLRLVGDPNLPREIPVEIQMGRAFTIGRFDVSVGHPQSDFEFDKNTKSVSRHHAAIERETDGSYILVDLSSSAGTFLDGQRLRPNVPYPLARGSKVSFGTSGADYIWEEV